MYFAKLQNVPTSPRKMRLVADMIRGMEVNVLNIKGEDTGRKVTLNESIFGIEPRCV